MREKEYLISVEDETGKSMHIVRLLDDYYIVVKQLANGNILEEYASVLYGPYKHIKYASSRLKALAQDPVHKYTKFCYKTIPINTEE